MTTCEVGDPTTYDYIAGTAVGKRVPVRIVCQDHTWESADNPQTPMEDYPICIRISDGYRYLKAQVPRMIVAVVRAMGPSGERAYFDDGGSLVCVECAPDEETLKRVADAIAEFCETPPHREPGDGESVDCSGT